MGTNTGFKKKLTRTASLCGISAGLIDLPIIILFGELHPRYNNIEHFASALGAVGNPHAGLISAWWVVYGIMLLIFSYGLLISMRKERRLWWLGPLFIMIFAASDGIGSGVFPCDPGCAGITFTGKMHMLVSTIGTTALVPAPFFVWNAWRGDERWRGYRYFTILIQIVGILDTLALTLSTSGRTIGFFSQNGGLIQRFFFLTYYAWIVAVALKLFRLPAPSD